MPQIGLAAWAAIASMAAAATTTGVSLYEASNQPGSPKPASTTATPLTSSQNASQSAAVGQQLPSLQAMTGGSVSPEYAAQYGATQSGVANDPQATGNIQSAINQFFGLTAPGSSGLTSPGGSSAGNTGTDILSLLSKPGRPSGSSTPSPLPGAGGGASSPDFVSNLLSSDTFRGLAG